MRGPTPGEERPSSALGCAALAAIALAVAVAVGAALTALRAARGSASGHELVIAARTPAGSIEVAESELCPRLERAVPAERASFSEATEDGCTVHVPVSPDEAIELAERVRGALAAESEGEPPWIQRVEPAESVWAIADRAPRDGARVLEDLQRDLESISGVAAVEICGPEQAIAVRVDPSAIAARALSVGDVIAALSRERPAEGVIGRGDRMARAGSLEETEIAPGTSLRDVAAIVETVLPRECDAALGGESVAAMRVDLAPWDTARALTTVRAVVGERARIIEPERSLRVAGPGEIDPGRLSESAGALVHRDEDGVGVEVLDPEVGEPGVEERIAQMPGLAIVHAGHPVARLWAPRDADVAEITRRLRELELVVAPLAPPARSEIAATIDRDRAAALGVSPDEISASISAWRGVELRDEDGRRVQVRLDLPETTDGLAQIVVPTRDRGAVRLVEVVTIAERVPDPARHRRRGTPALGLLVSSRDTGADHAAVARALAGLDLEIEPL